MNYKMLLATSLMLLLCSCAVIDSGPEKQYLGQWRGTQEEETIGVQLEQKQRCIITHDSKAWVGRWTVEGEEITITAQNQTVRGFINSEGDLVLSTEDGGEALVFKKVE